MRVMMSAAASPSAISILLHLRSLGHHITGIDANSDAEQLGKVFCDEFYIGPLGNSPEYLDFICTRLEHVDVFLPFVDEELVALANSWERLPTSLTNKIALSEPSVVLDCVDKQRFQAACAKNGLPIAPHASSPPAIFKPRLGRGGRGVLSIDDQRIYDAVKDHDGVMQQMIFGTEYTVDAIYDREGKLLMTSPRKRVRAAGVSTIGEVLPDERLHALAQQLGSAWKFRYAINFQVIRDVDGHDWIIELNPRLAGSAIFSAMAGCDPFAATLALWQGSTWKVSAPRPLKVWRFWAEHTEEQLKVSDRPHSRLGAPR